MSLNLATYQRFAAHICRDEFGNLLHPYLHLVEIVAHYSGPSLICGRYRKDREGVVPNANCRRLLLTRACAKRNLEKGAILAGWRLTSRLLWRSRAAFLCVCACACMSESGGRSWGQEGHCVEHFHETALFYNKCLKHLLRLRRYPFFFPLSHFPALPSEIHLLSQISSLSTN